MLFRSGGVVDGKEVKMEVAAGDQVIYGVNITAGLPFIRTSADHGTAFDIAWTGKAKSESMAVSIKLAMQLA